MCRVYRCICKKAEKIGRAMMRKRWRISKKAWPVVRVGYYRRKCETLKGGPTASLKKGGARGDNLVRLLLYPPLPTIENEKQNTFQFVSVWFWCSRGFVISYIFTKHEIWSTSILNCCKKILVLERTTLLCSAPATQPRYATEDDPGLVVQRK